MTYNKILKQRRQALQLSIQDISSQTRLAPNYIQALEENHLEVFQGDVSYIRYFVQAYCEAIGVNYAAISDEVETVLAAYSRQYAAYTQAQEPQAAPKAEKAAPAAQKKRTTTKAKSKKNKNLNKNKLVRSIQKMNRSKHAHVYQLIACGVVVVLFLSIVNAGLSYRTNKRLAQEEAQRQTEIKQKEKETAQLANQKKTSDSESSKTVKLKASDKDNNVYEVSGIVGHSDEVTVTVTLPEDSTVAVYKDDELITDDADKVYSGTFKQTFKVEDACLIQVEIGTYSNNKIRLNGKSVSFSKANWTEGTSAVLYFDILDKNGKSSEKDTDSSTTDSSQDESADTSYDASYDQSYDASYGTGEDYTGETY